MGNAPAVAGEPHRGSDGGAWVVCAAVDAACAGGVLDPHGWFPGAATGVGAGQA